jgi:hypothetical protein
MSENQEIPEHVRVRLLDQYPVLEYFVYSQLPTRLQAASKPFADLAWSMAMTAVDPATDSDLLSSPDIPCIRHHPELAEGLRKLLEGKDCFVRAYMMLRSKV